MAHIFTPALRRPLSKPFARSGTRTLIQRAIASLRARGTDAHLWLPGGDVKTYGPELVTNGGPFTATTGWSALNSTIDVVSQELRITNGASSYGIAHQSFPTVVGGRYVVTGTARIGTTTAVGLYFGTGIASFANLQVFLNSATNAPFSYTFTASSGTTYLSLINQSNTTGHTSYFSSISVREITSQTSAILNGLTTGNYLESTGNSLATVNNPCGLVLDALGSVSATELVTNGGFASSGTDWTASGGVTFAVGSASFVNTTTNTDNLFQFLPLSAGKTYRVTIAGTGIVNYRVDSADSAVQITLPATVNPYKASVTGARVQVYNVSGSAAVITSISVREVSGIHLTQGTTANKPVLRRGLTNLLTYSSDFSNAIWIKIGSSVSANATTDPMGGTAASKIIAAATTNWHLVDQNAIPANTPVTFAVYAKAAEETKLALSDYSSSTGCLFDLTAVTATVSGTDAALTISNPSIVSVGDGWYLCSVNMLATATKRAAICVRQFATSYLGNGTSGVYVYRALLTPGTLTAAQILAAGGIPVTTTAAASNPNAGRYNWAFDSTDVLTTTIPAGWETATIIDAAPTGAMASVQNVVGTHSIRGAMVTGVNLVTNGDFSNGTTGWTAGNGSIAVVSGECVFTKNGVVGAGIFSSSAITTVVGTKYDVVADYRKGTTTTDGYVWVSNNADGSGYYASSAVVSSDPSVSFTATSTVTYVGVRSDTMPAGSTYVADNISVYEINPVTHARILVKGTLTEAETDLYKSLANSFK